MDTTTNNQTLLNNSEAAAYLGVNEGTLTVWRSCGRYNLPFIKVGRLVRYRMADLNAFLDSRSLIETKKRTPTELIDGDAYRFNYKGEVLLGFYKEVSDAFHFGESLCPAPYCVNITRLMPATK